MHLPIPLDLLPLLMVGLGAAVLLARTGGDAIRRRRARQRRRSEKQQQRQWIEEPYTASFESTLLDVQSEVLGVMRQIDGLAARNHVRLQVAVQPDLAVRANARGIRRALTYLLENAIDHAPGGKVFVVAMRRGGRVQIAVLDDGRGPGRREQEAVLRSVERIVALHGGTLEVETRPSQGTLVMLRLPEPQSTTGAAPRAQDARAPDARAPDAETSRGASEPVATGAT